MSGDLVAHGGEGPRCRKRGHGWDVVASRIVTDMSHLLPPQAPNWPSWLLSGIHYYREDGSLVVDTYEGRWRDEQTGEGGTVFTLLVRLLGSWGAARRWLRDGGYMRAIGPGPRREPSGRCRDRQKRRTGNDRAPEADRFWNPVQVQGTGEAARAAPALPVADQLELWPEDSLDNFIRRNLEASAKFRAEEERRWQEEMAKLPPAERNFREAQRWKRLHRHGMAQ